MKLSASPETIASYAAVSSESARASPTSKRTRWSVTFSRACSINAADGSTPFTPTGCWVLAIISLSAPVPQPTSSQRLLGGTLNQSKNSRATMRLQRPIKLS